MRAISSSGRIVANLEVACICRSKPEASFQESGVCGDFLRHVREFVISHPKRKHPDWEPIGVLAF
jgi:hypothetical protein